MSRPRGMPSWCMLCIACFSTWRPSYQQISSGLFSAMKCDGDPVCLLYKPSRSFTVRSQMHCVSECKRTQELPGSCVGVNYRPLNNECEVFSNNAPVTESSPFKKDPDGCQYIQSGGVDNLRCSSMLRTTNPCTLSGTGCQCWFDPKRFDCACCGDGCSPCGLGYEHLCVTSGLDLCTDFTRTPTGCACWWDNSLSYCACCYDYGCPCGSDKPHKCTQCNSPGC